MMKLYAIMTMLLFGLLAACATAPVDSDDAKTPDERAITMLINSHLAAYNAENTQAVLAAFAPEARIESPLAPGAAASRDQYATMLRDVGFQYKAFLRELNVKVLSLQLAEAKAIVRLVDKDQNLKLIRVYRFERFEGTWRIIDARFEGPVPQLLHRQK